MDLISIISTVSVLMRLGSTVVRELGENRAKEDDFSFWSEQFGRFSDSLVTAKSLIERANRGEDVSVEAQELVAQRRALSEAIDEQLKQYRRPR